VIASIRFRRMRYLLGDILPAVNGEASAPRKLVGAYAWPQFQQVPSTTLRACPEAWSGPGLAEGGSLLALASPPIPLPPSESNGLGGSDPMGLKRAVPAAPAEVDDVEIQATPLVGLDELASSNSVCPFLAMLMAATRSAFDS